MIITPFKPLKASEKLRIAYANGCRTMKDYAEYRKTKVIPDYMNKAILNQYEKEKQK